MYNPNVKIGAAGLVLGPVPEFKHFAPLPRQHLFLSLDRFLLMNRIRIGFVVISATCPKHLNERLRNPSLKRSSYHGNGSLYTKLHCEMGAFLAPVGAISYLKIVSASLKKFSFTTIVTSSSNVFHKIEIFRSFFKGFVLVVLTKV